MSARCSRRFLCSARRRGYGKARLRAVGFLVSTLFRRFLYHFLEPSYTRARGWKLRRKIVIRADDYYRSALLRGRWRGRRGGGLRTSESWELALSLARARTLGRKNDVCSDTRITSDSPGRVTASLLGTSAWTTTRRLVSALFSRYSVLILHSRCE